MDIKMIRDISLCEEVFVGMFVVLIGGYGRWNEGIVGFDHISEGLPICKRGFGPQFGSLSP